MKERLPIRKNSTWIQSLQLCPREVLSAALLRTASIGPLCRASSAAYRTRKSLAQLSAERSLSSACWVIAPAGEGNISQLVVEQHRCCRQRSWNQAALQLLRAWWACGSACMEGESRGHVSGFVWAHEQSVLSSGLVIHTLPRWPLLPISHMPKASVFKNDN